MVDAVFTSQSRLRILIIEDDPVLVEDMKKAWKNLRPADGLNFLKFERTRASARLALLKNRYHIVSSDLALMAYGKYEMPDSDLGGGLSVLTSPGSSILNKKIIYTGTPSMPEGARERAIDWAGECSVLILQKGVNKPSNYPPTANVFRWAYCVMKIAGLSVDDPEGQNYVTELEKSASIKSRLTPYFTSFWQNAERYLPEPLAKNAKTILEAIQTNTFLAHHILAVQRFRLWVLILARIQTFILKRAQTGKVSAVLTIYGDDDSATRELERYFKETDEYKQVWRKSWPSWFSHLGSTSITEPIVLGKAAQQLREFRNQQVHSLSNTIKIRLDQIQPPLWALMDAAAYWADYPFFMQLHLNGASWKATAPVGLHTYLWRDFELPDELRFNPRNIRSDRILQIQWKNQDEASFEPVLVNLWPWLRLDKNQDDTPTILALWYPVKQLRKGYHLWQAYTFAGEAKQIEVADIDFENP